MGGAAGRDAARRVGSIALVSAAGARLASISDGSDVTVVRSASISSRSVRDPRVSFLGALADRAQVVSTGRRMLSFLIREPLLRRAIGRLIEAAR